MLKGVGSRGVATANNIECSVKQYWCSIYFFTVSVHQFTLTYLQSHSQWFYYSALPQESQSFHQVLTSTVSAVFRWSSLWDQRNAFGRSCFPSRESERWSLASAWLLFITCQGMANHLHLIFECFCSNSKWHNKSRTSRIQLTRRWERVRLRFVVFSGRKLPGVISLPSHSSYFALSPWVLTTH